MIYTMRSSGICNEMYTMSDSISKDHKKEQKKEKTN